MTETHSALVEMTLSRMKEFYREPGAVFWAFGFPVLLAVALGIAFRNRPPDATRVAIAAVGESAWLEEALKQGGVQVVTVGAEPVANLALSEGKVDLVVRPLDRQSVTYRFDPANAAGNLARHVVDASLQKALGRADAVVSRDEIVS